MVGEFLVSQTRINIYQNTDDPIIEKAIEVVCKECMGEIFDYLGETFTGTQVTGGGINKIESVKMGLNR